VSTDIADTIEGRVKEIVAEQLGLNAEEISVDAAFARDLGADALDVVELVMAFEEEFDIDIDDDDAEKLHTVQAVVAYLDGRMQ
jgi:acyl carrier protein